MRVSMSNNYCHILPKLSILWKEADQSHANGTRYTMEFVDESPAVVNSYTRVQVRKLQHYFLEIRRITHRATIQRDGDTWHITAYYDGTRWHCKRRKFSQPTQLWDPVTAWTPPPAQPTPLENAARLAQVRAIASGFKSEGAFLDWLAWKTPLGIVVNSVRQIDAADLDAITEYLKTGTEQAGAQ
jgi:hypothetical protein